MTDSLRAVVIIPTLGELSDLGRCLESLSRQTRPVEVLVVDSRPSDAARALAARYGFAYLPDDHRDRAAACNHALRTLDCDVVLFTDDDCYPPPEWAARLIRHFARPEVDGVGGPHVAPPDQSFWGRALDVAFSSPLMSVGLRYSQIYPDLREVRHNPGCNSAYRKRVLDAVGGFADGTYGAEDVVLDHLITARGHRLWFDPEALTYHRRRDRAATIARQMFSYGRGRADANARYPAVAHLGHALPSALLVGGVAMAAASLATAGACVATGRWPFPARSRAGRLAAGVIRAPLYALGGFWGAGALSALASPSPHRDVSVALAAPAVMLLSIAEYGRGYLHWHRALKAQRSP